MGILNNILEKAGFGQIPKEFSGATNTPPSAVPLSSVAPSLSDSAANHGHDVVTQLDHAAQRHHENINWRQSIADLMKLLGLDNSLESRRSLASELKCPTEEMDDSSRMDAWLHQTVLRKLAESGGNVPPELFH